MDKRRRRIIASLLGSFAAGSGRGILLGGVGILSSQRAAAVEPLTAITVAQTTLGLLRAFSARSDGGLSAYLQSIHEVQKLSLNLLDEIAKSIGNLALQINDLRNEIPILLEQSRLRAYLDDAISAQTQFRILRNSYDSATKTQKAKLNQDFLAVELQIVAARGRADNYSSFDAALAVPLCLSVEIASKYQNGKSVLIPETLRHYLNWVDRILDPKALGSLARTVKDDAATFVALVSAAKYKDGAVIGCVAPRATVFYWPDPDVNQRIYNSKVLLTTRQITASFSSRQAGITGAKEIYLTSATLNLMPDQQQCDVRDMTTTFGISLENRGVMISAIADTDSFSGMASEPEISKLIEEKKAAYQPELDAINRKALRLALLSDAVITINETRKSILRALQELGEI